MTKPELSVIIPYHQEGVSFITDTVTSVISTIDIGSIEIIIVDDGSKIPLGDMPYARVLRHKKNLGVGQAFNTGVKDAKSDNLFLMGSDIRFLNNGWASKMIKEMNDHPTAYACSTCVGLNEESEEGMDIEKRQHKSRRNGSSILMFWDHKSHPKMAPNFRSILQCQWLSVYKGESKESFEIPAILGASYGVKKAWYEYTNPWVFHRSWGCLEPEVSLRSWFFGGSCRTTPDILVGHIFKRNGTHGTPQHHVLYNRLQTAELLFDDYHSNRLKNFVKQDNLLPQAMRLFRENEKQIAKQRKENQAKIVVDASEWCKRWGIDFRQES